MTLLPGRVLIVRAGALGDLLLLRPVIAALRAAGQALTLLSPAPGQVLVGPDEVDLWLDWDAREVASLLGGACPPQGSWRTAVEACQRALVYTRATECARGLSALGLEVLSHAPAPPPTGGRHAAAWLAEPLAAWGWRDVRSPTPTPLRYLSAELAATATVRARLPARFLALHAGSGAPEKNWPAQRFAELADSLAPGQPFLLVRGPAESGATPPATERAVLAEQLPLRVLGALLGQAGLYVGNDSGVSHLAAASGAPCLVLFGPTDPNLWRPVGARVVALRADPRFDALDVDQVATAGRTLRGW